MVKRILNWLFEKTGLHIIRPVKYNGSTKFNINEFHYAVVNPSANYSPWNGDKSFLDIYSKINKNTLVDIYRCYELWELTEQIFQLNPQACFIEIGVWRGGTAAIIGKKLKNINANIDFYLADTFDGVKKSSKKDSFYFNGEHNDTSIEIVQKLLLGNYNNFKILKGLFPDDTSNNILPDKKFGFCHIDVDVYESAKDIVEWIWDKLIVGGIIVFDDYGFHSCDGVTKYVNEIRVNKDNIVFHNLNGHAILVKLA